MAEDIRLINALDNNNNYNNNNNKLQTTANNNKARCVDGDRLPRVTPASLMSERMQGTVINNVSSSSAASSKLSTCTLQRAQ